MFNSNIIKQNVSQNNLLNVTSLFKNSEHDISFIKIESVYNLLGLVMLRENKLDNYTKS